MSSVDHYAKAQQLAGQAHDYTYGDGADPVTGNALAAEAQVHATLALVDAIADQTQILLVELRQISGAA